MKVITTYVAYDDKEFDNPSDCKAYEEQAQEMVYEANNAFLFFDKDMNRLWPFNGVSIEEWLKWFDAVIDTCDYVRVRAIPSRELHKFIYRNIGACLPEHKIGWFKYDYNTNEWVSAD